MPSSAPSTTCDEDPSEAKSPTVKGGSGGLGSSPCRRGSRVRFCGLSGVYCAGKSAMKEIHFPEWPEALRRAEVLPRAKASYFLLSFSASFPRRLRRASPTNSEPGTPNSDLSAVASAFDQAPAARLAKADLSRRSLGEGGEELVRGFPAKPPHVSAAALTQNTHALSTTMKPFPFREEKGKTALRTES
jgi:hypothetical protein